MANIWHEIRWTRKEVERCKSVAMRKRYEADAALQAACDIEVEYWNQVLAKKFPDLRDEFRRNYVNYRHEYFVAVVSFSDDDNAECIIGLPEKSWGGTIHDYHTRIKVWHRTANNKRFRQDCIEYRCDEIIPFIKTIRPIPKPDKKAEPTIERQEVEQAIAETSEND